MPNSIYLDHNSTTSLLPEVREALGSMLGAWPQNSSSIHKFGRNSRKLMEAARSKIALSLGKKASDEYRIIFTSCGTESNNFVMNGFPGSSIIISPIEHLSITRAAQNAGRLAMMQVDSNGLIDVEHYDKLLASYTGPKLVSVIYANNETGAVQDIQLLCQIAHKHGAIFHTDAVQAYGKLDFDISELDVDLMTISAHKCGGLIGTSAVIFKKDLNPQALLSGGGQELGYRSGTENLPAIYSFGLIAENLATIKEKMQATSSLRDYLEQQITAFKPVTIFAKEAQRLPNTSCLTMNGVDNEIQLIGFDMRNIAVSSGSACSSGKVSASYVLSAMNVPTDIAKTAIRISLGPDSTQDEINKFIEAYKDIYQTAGNNVNQAIVNK